MERTLSTFAYMATWWDQRSAREFVASAELKEGLVAYRAEQADMYRRLRTLFEAAWAAYKQHATVFLARESVLDEIL